MWFALLMMPFIRRKEFWFLLIAVWASIWIQPHIWYDRYIPHLWVIPIIVACCMLSQFNGVAEYRWRIIFIVAIVLLCMLVSIKPQRGFVEPRIVQKGTGIVSYFVQNHPGMLFFDTDNVPFKVMKFGAKTYVSDMLPDYSFERWDQTSTSRKSWLGYIHGHPVYLIAETQEELDRLASIKPRRKEMYRAILHLRWQQLQRAWGAGKE